MGSSATFIKYKYDMNAHYDHSDFDFGFVDLPQHLLMIGLRQHLQVRYIIQISTNKKNAKTSNMKN